MKMLDAVFIQPTYSCALDCKGCYVKESTKSAQQETAKLFKDFVDWLLENNQVRTRQITLAVDNLPSPRRVSMRDPVHRTRVAMLDILHHLITTIDKSNPNHPELHLTVNSPEAATEYFRELGPEIDTQAMSTVTLVSYSHLAQRHLSWLQNSKPSREAAQLEVNYNYMPDGRYDLYREVLEHVDMSYVILHKAGLGKRNDPKQIQVFKEALRVIDTWPRHLKDKVIVDSCVTDSYKFKTTGFGCSANISKVHVWPDGHVTGCPYNKDGGRPAYELVGLVNNLKEALNRYEFLGETISCTIPGDFYGRGDRRTPGGSKLHVVTSSD